MQITWLPIQGPEQKAAKAKALEYMAAIIRTVAPLLTKEQSQKKLQKMLIAVKVNTITPRPKAQYVMLSQITAKRG